MWPFKKKEKQLAPEQKAIPIRPAPAPSRVPDDSIVTIRAGIDKKKANMQKLRETLNGCLPPDERTVDGEDGLAKLALALNRSRSR